MHGCLDLYDASLRIFCTGLGALGDDIDTLYDCSVLFNQHFEDSTSLAFVVAGIDIDCVAFLYMQFCHGMFVLRD